MTHAIDSELSGEWLQARPSERFSIRIPASATDGCYSVTVIVPATAPRFTFTKKRTSISSGGGNGARLVWGQDARRHGENDD
jgi:hypothetical protein